MTWDEVGKACADLAPRLALYAVAHLRLPREDAVDAVQSAVVRLLSHVNAGELETLTREKLTSYLFGAVRSYASHLRQKTNRREWAETFLWTTLTPEPPADPETELLTKEQSERLTRAISRLSEPYRSIFALQAKRETTLAELAKELGVSVQGIYNQYRRGRRELKKLLDEV